jgi:hypothetical protein
MIQVDKLSSWQLSTYSNVFSTFRIWLLSEPHFLPHPLPNACLRSKYESDGNIIQLRSNSRYQPDQDFLLCMNDLFIFYTTCYLIQTFNYISMLHRIDY